MKTILYFIAFFILITTFNATSQEYEPYVDGRPQKWDISMEMTIKKMIEEGRYEEWLEFRRKTKQLADSRLDQFRSLQGTKALRTIPIVVHVLYNPNDTGSEPNVSDADIFDMINVLNEDFTATNADITDVRPIFTSVIGDAQINFCLATTDPNGDPTDGIHRVDVTMTTWPQNDDMKFDANGGADAWDPTSYINVWICDITDGMQAGTAGYAYLPGMHGQPEDGLVLDSDIGIGDYFGNSNRTATHELGHYWGLEHIWADGGCTVDDGFADTPTGSSDNMSVQDCNPTTPPNTCDDGAGDLPDQYENYMSYATCQRMFTIEQGNYMNTTLDGTRASLLSSTVCGPLLDADFVANQTNIFAGQNVTFTDLSTTEPGETITAWNWSFPGGSITSSTDQNPPAVTYGSPGTYTVTLQVTDGSGNNDTETKTDYIIVDAAGNITADFYANPTMLLPGTSTNFYDLSSGAVVVFWDWTFNGVDPPDNASTDANPANITYNILGTYDVTLTVSDGQNTSTITKPDYIQVVDSIPLNALFTCDDQNVTTDQSVQFINQSTGSISTYEWIFESNGTSSTMNPLINWATAGVYDVTLIVHDAVGNTDTLYRVDYINVSDPIVPAALFSGTPLYIEDSNFVTFTNNCMNDPVEWAWSFPGGTPASSNLEDPPLIYYYNIGKYDVQLIATNSAGADTLLRVEYVEVVDPNLPVADFFGDTTTIMVNDSVFFTDLTLNDPIQWEWIFEGGSPAVSTDTSFASIVYNTPGFYDVTLVATNIYGSDTAYKDNYIHVIDTNDVGADFVADQTLIYVGDSVNFTDLAVGDPETWTWTFTGGTPANSTEQHPDSIFYYTPGVYPVKQVVQRGMSVDSLIKIDYITVMPLGNYPPQAAFYSPKTSLCIGDSTSFIDLTLDSVNTSFSYYWLFEGANPSVSNIRNPYDIEYTDTGYFDVTLIVCNTFACDTFTIPNCVHVIYCDSLTSGPEVDFYTQERLIPMGTTIHFSDSTSGNPSYWHWQFEVAGGGYSDSYDQNPGDITYDVPGIYDVCLTAANYLGTDSLCKVEYIVVSDTTWADTLGFCDTISNFEGITTTFYNLEYEWGYFPGHNGDRMRGYADRFVNYTFGQIEAMIVPVEKTVPGETGGYVRFKMWEGDEYPETEITSKKIQLSTLYPKLYCVVEFDSVIPIDGNFFAGFELVYAAADAEQDTFVVSMEPDRGPTGHNSLYILRSGIWRTPYEYADYYEEEDIRINTALGIKLIGCLLDVEEKDSDPELDILIFPNPANDIININLGEIDPREVTLNVYSTMGQLIFPRQARVAGNHYTLDFSNVASGLYFVNIVVDDKMVTKRVSIIK